MLLSLQEIFVRILVSFVVCGSRGSLVGVRAQDEFPCNVVSTLGAYVECN